ncbi:hypothetical protein [Actinoplanes friuliensis]|uniref:DUF2306 domain-containing protein n=1 Tax=Actinoplanes friuliensis DSM 7358 TaxID=1246995 RepID=U5VTJ6_9ACTN|nr:hypothetical protein [Actinoplanes friuliensis]AGZ40179.1 hypothetical protein AFR_09450 [Actinoplanes friuliensis DSM 7358]
MEWFHPTLIALHATAGGLGLLLAIPVITAPKRRGRHPILGRAYALCAAVLCLTAFVLVAYDPLELTGLAVLGALTTIWVGAGVWLARKRPVIRGNRHAWRLWHLNLMSSSVISFVTAFLVQITDGNLIAWTAPTVIGTALITRANVRESARLAARSPRPEPVLVPAPLAPNPGPAQAGQ